MMNTQTQTFQPNSFQRTDHFYPQVLNAHMHPLVRTFFTLGNDRIAERYHHLNPHIPLQAIQDILARRLEHFRWGGSDLFFVATEQGQRRTVIIETNSCPSGQKSMPPLHEDLEEAGYRSLLERSFLPALKRRSLPSGQLAVLFDKNPMEVTGYAKTLAELTQEPVHLVPCFADDPDPKVRLNANRILEARLEDGSWVPLRAALRYVTQSPWTRIPPITRTLLFNPVLVCLAGGRNKMLAAKAYDIFNAELRPNNLHIHTPETIWDVSLSEVPLWVQRMGGIAVVKVPYSNAGQGVYTITNDTELDDFMNQPHRYDRFIVQALIGNTRWTSQTRSGRLTHLGTVPNKHRQIFVADVRMMLGSSPDGFYPVAVYARRARKPLARDLEAGASSWDMLGTNLSHRHEDGSFSTDPSRLMLMDVRDFNRLGLGLDDLIEGYLQSALAMSAIDAMSCQLLTQKRRFRTKLFRSLNPDPSLIDELYLPPSKL